MPRRLLSRLLLLSLPMLVLVAPAGYGADDVAVAQAETLIRKMALANRDTDYRGVFTYEHAGTLKSVRITHAVVDGLEYEKLLYLSGPRREVVRAGISPACRNIGDDLLQGVPVPADFSTHLEASYELFLKGEDRVADRRVRVIHVVPRDGMRYGYILSVDAETGLLLQSLLVGPNRRVLERFQFVDIEVGLAADTVAALVDSSDGVPQEPEDCAEPVADVVNWQATWLPTGFRLVKAAASGSEGESMIYSDGLSFVSVFVNDGQNGGFPPIQAQRGATVAQMTMLDHNGRKYQICVVGEVPAAAAEKIAQSVAPRR